MVVTSQTDLEGLHRSLQDRLTDIAEARVEVTGVAPLTGGACQDNFRVDLVVDGAPQAMAMRSDAARSLPRSISRRQEYGVIRAAVDAGVRTPDVRWLMEGLLRDGSWAYLMDWAQGVAIGRRVLRDDNLAEARAGLVDNVAQEMARIHTVTPATNPDLFSSPADNIADAALASVQEMVDEMREAHPALELALRWLRAHRPADLEITLNHGDFRTGNFMLTPEGFSALLDWEFAQWGAPEEDLAWICVRDWRFGRVDRPVGGFGDRASLYEAYTRHSGRPVRPEVVHWYEILGNVRWATGCVFQGERYLSGEERDVELIAIARRAAEMELEALRLIEVGCAV